MATVMLMRWEGVTEDEYEQARETVGWDRDVPDGARLHVAGFSDGVINVLDVWESAEAFGRFSEQRLMPAVQEIGIQGAPDVRFIRCTPASHRRWAAPGPCAICDPAGARCAPALLPRGGAPPAGPAGHLDVVAAQAGAGTAPIC